MKKRLFLIITCAFVIMCFMSAGAFAEQSKTDASTESNTPVAVAQAEGGQQTDGGQTTESPPAENPPATTQLLASTPVANQTTTVYDGTTAEKAWQVSTPAELKSALEKGGYISITQDFSFTETWTPVTLTKAVTIDGNNHTLTGLNVTNALKGGNTGQEGSSHSGYDVGLIGTTSANITISNLTFADAEINPAKTLGQDESYIYDNGFSQVAVIAGSTTKSAATTLTNVHIKNSKVVAGTKCGLFVGNAGTGTVTITGCSAEDSTVTGNYSYALLVGLASGTVTIDEATKVKNCSTKFVVGSEFKQTDYDNAETINGYKYSKYTYPDGNKKRLFTLDANGGWVNSRKSTAVIDGVTYNSTDVITYDGVASINGWEYQSLNAAINSAQDGDTITLLKDVTLSSNFVLSNGNKVTLNLNNKTINTSKDGYFLITHGELDVTGTGVVSHTGTKYPFKVVGTKTSTDANHSVLELGENVTINSESYSILIGPYAIDTDGVSNFGAVVTVRGKINAKYGPYTNGQMKETEGAVSIVNITDTAEITANKDGNGDGIYAAGYAKWNIAGKITGSSAISAKSGEFNITGGKYHSWGEFADPADANGNGSEDTGAAFSITSNDGYAKKIVVNISGGEFTSDNGYALYEGIAVVKNEQGNVTGNAATASYATLGISGGTFTGNADKDAVNISTATNKKVITGGTFSSDPSAYLADGYEAKAGTDGKYTVALKNPEKVVDSVNSKLDTKTQQGEVAVEVGKGVAVEDKETAKAVAKSVSADLTETKATKEITVSDDDKKTAVQKLVATGQVQINDQGDVVSTSGGEVTITIIEEPYLEVEVTEIKTDEDTGKKELTLDVTPMYNLKATVTTGTQGAQSTSDAVTVSTGNALNVEEKTDVKLQLPEGFAEAGDKLLVTHTKHDGSVEYLTGKVTKEGGVLYVSFTTTGFSPIVVSDNYAATNGEQVYPTLQAAVDAVKNGETIKLYKDGETAVVRRTVSFTVDPSYKVADDSTGNYTYTITLGDGTTRNKTDNENEWSTVYTAPAKTDTTKAGTAKTAKAPATGDNSELGLFAVVGLISAVGVALLLRRKQSM